MAGNLGGGGKCCWVLLRGQGRRGKSEFGGGSE
jgi:hypothetical protein